MKRSWLIALKEAMSWNRKQPWACFETTGPSKDGRVEFSISANKAFIENLKALGMGGTTDEETVQMFFVQTRMIPEDLMGDDTVSPEATPNLTHEANKFVRG